MDFYKTNVVANYMVISSINTTLNVITLSNPFGSIPFDNRKTPFSLLANPPTETIDSYAYDYKWIIFGAVYRVVFSSTNPLTGNFSENVVYYVRATGSYTCKVYLNVNDAFNETNAIALAGSIAAGDRMNFLFKNNYYVNPCKDFATPHQCCPALPPINTQDVFTGCTVTFKNRQIDCYLEFFGGQLYGSHHLGPSNGNKVLFYGKITDFVNSLGHTVSLICLVQITKVNLETKIEIEIQIPYYSVSGVYYSDTYSVFTKANTTHANFTAIGTVTGDSFQSATTADYNFNHTGNINQTAKLKLISAAFVSGNLLPTKFGVGDINELLTFNPDTRCYESELKNYYNIPGRLTVPLTTFYPPDDGFKFVLANYPITLNYEKRYFYGRCEFYDFGNNNISDYITYQSIAFPNWEYLFQKKIIDSISAYDFYAHVEITSSPYVYYYSRTAIAVQYSRSKNAKTSSLNYSSEIEPFYKSSDFYIGSTEPGSFFSTYKLT